MEMCIVKKHQFQNVLYQNKLRFIVPIVPWIFRSTVFSEHIFILKKIFKFKLKKKNYNYTILPCFLTLELVALYSKCMCAICSR